MSKIRIYIESQNVKDSVEVVDRNVVHKIKDVLRLKSNDSVYVFDGEGREYLYKISRIDKGKVVLDKKKQVREEPAASARAVLGFPIIREGKIDFILQKATELGVDGFIPFICSRSLRTVPKKERLTRWQRIVLEAVRQSGRLWVPEVRGVLRFEDIVKEKFSLKLVASIEGKNFSSVLRYKAGDTLVMVGPEGDFSPSEYEQLKSEGFLFIRLSKNILRTETAAILSIGVIKAQSIESS